MAVVCGWVVVAVQVSDDEHGDRQADLAQSVASGHPHVRTPADPSGSGRQSRQEVLGLLEDLTGKSTSSRNTLLLTHSLAFHSLFIPKLVKLVLGILKMIINK